MVYQGFYRPPEPNICKLETCQGAIRVRVPENTIIQHQDITQIVRGQDLASNTPRQVWLQQLLGYPTPQYLHNPLVVNASFEKSSKQTKAPVIWPQNT
jgi:hypothetical protein